MSVSRYVSLSILLLTMAVSVMLYYHWQQETVQRQIVLVAHEGSLIGEAFIVDDPVVLSNKTNRTHYALTIADKNNRSARTSLAFMKGIFVPGECGKPPRRGDKVEVVVPVAQLWNKAGWNSSLGHYYPEGWEWKAQPVCR